MKNILKQELIIEANNCLSCYDAKCSKVCPANMQPDKFIKSVKLDNIESAAKHILEKNIFGGSCGAICKHEKFCQKNCVKNNLSKPVDIAYIQSAIIKYASQDNINFKYNNIINKLITITGNNLVSYQLASLYAIEGYKVELILNNNYVSALDFIIGDKELIKYEINQLKNKGVIITYTNDFIDDEFIEKKLKQSDKLIITNNFESIDNSSMSAHYINYLINSKPNYFNKIKTICFDLLDDVSILTGKKIKEINPNILITFLIREKDFFASCSNKSILIFNSLQANITLKLKDHFDLIIKTKNSNEYNFGLAKNLKCDIQWIPNNISNPKSNLFFVCNTNGTNSNNFILDIARASIFKKKISGGKNE